MILMILVELKLQVGIFFILMNPYLQSMVNSNLFHHFQVLVEFQYDLKMIK